MSVMAVTAVMRGRGRATGSGRDSTTRMLFVHRPPRGVRRRRRHHRRTGSGFGARGVGAGQSAGENDGEVDDHGGGGDGEGSTWVGCSVGRRGQRKAAGRDLAVAFRPVAHDILCRRDATPPSPTTTTRTASSPPSALRRRRRPETPHHNRKYRRRTDDSSRAARMCRRLQRNLAQNRKSARRTALESFEPRPRAHLKTIFRGDTSPRRFRLPRCDGNK